MRCRLLVIFIVMTSVAISFAAVPQTINYQGHLASSGGSPVNVAVDMSFTIYDAETNGSNLWTEAQTVQVNKGIYAVALGAINPIDPVIIDGDLWLGVRVGTDAEMTPRQKLNSVPFALRAQNVADGSVTGSSIASGSITSGLLDSSIVTLDQFAPTCLVGQGLYRTASGWECREAQSVGEKEITIAGVAFSGDAGITISKDSNTGAVYSPLGQEEVYANINIPLNATITGFKVLCEDLGVVEKVTASLKKLVPGSPPSVEVVSLLSSSATNADGFISLSDFSLNNLNDTSSNYYFISVSVDSFSKLYYVKVFYSFL